MTLIQVLGPGCAKCAKLKENAAQAVENLGIARHLPGIITASGISGIAHCIAGALR